MRAILALLFLLGGLNAAHAQCAPPFNWSGFYPPAALDRVAQRTTPGLGPTSSRSCCRASPIASARSSAASASISAGGNTPSIP